MSTRRDFLAQVSAFGLALAGVPRLPIWRRPRFLANPFALGIASGDPSPTGIVLWTRLAPDPVNGGGMPGDAVNVRWEIAEDEGMRKVVNRGTATARPDLAHSVHAEADGLRPGRWYWYRFDAGGEASAIGRTRTAPPIEAADRLRFAFASCQHYESGLFTAYRHMSEEDLDLVAHLGDYIYEYNTAEAAAFPVPRRHLLAPATTLELYRNRYARYKSDPDLQAAHQQFPWIVTWDDHEVANNYANAISEDTTVQPSAFLLRRAAAYQAYYEHQPLRKAAIPRGPDALMYRTLDFGSLARFHVLDTRQYRSDQSCGDGVKVPCPAWSDTTRTMMGAMQERWFTRQADRSAAVWNVIAQQISFSAIYNPRQPELVYMDGWSGYPAARRRLTSYMAGRREKDFVVLTGDIHSNYVMDVKPDLRDATGPTLAAEFIGTSISSGGDGRDRLPQFLNYETDMPLMKYHSARRGYVTCDVSPNAFTSHYRELPFVARPAAPVTTAASFVVRRGRPGAVKL